MTERSLPPFRVNTVNAIRLATVAFIVALSASVVAQEPQRPSFVPDVVKHVLLDPTTYAPAIVVYEAFRLDWDTSQPLFQHGWNEHNARFTVSGLPNDLPLSYADGNRRIVLDALVVLQISAISNAVDTVVERLLVKGYPTHRTLIRRAGWVERISVAALLSYKLAGPHFRQVSVNEQLARQRGYTQ